MINKILMAALIAAASFNFTATSEAADYDSENYCRGNYYGEGCGYYGNGGCDYYDEDYRGEHHRGGYYGRGGCWR